MFMSQNGSGNDVNNEVVVLRRVNAGVAAAWREGRVIDVVTARLIAASVHRGLASALQRFAATGEFSDCAQRRLAVMELSLCAADTPAWRVRVAALKQFLRAQCPAKDEGRAIGGCND
jgi:hypothetical protein